LRLAAITDSLELIVVNGVERQVVLDPAIVADLLEQGQACPVDDGAPNSEGTSARRAT
jgi:hypothetical protein